MNSSRKSTTGVDLIEGLTNALAYAKGDRSKGRVRTIRVPAVDVKTLRRRLGLSQGRFAATFGVSVKTVRKWEQGERRPTGAARVLLAVIAREPEAVRRTLAIDRRRSASA